MMDFDYPSGKNQRFLPPPLTRGGFRGAVVIGTININLILFDFCAIIL